MKSLPATPLLLLLSSLVSFIIHAGAELEPINCAGYLYHEKDIAKVYVKAKNTMKNLESTMTPKIPNKHPFESYRHRTFGKKSEMNKYSSSAIVVPMNRLLHFGSKAYLVMDKLGSEWVAKKFVIRGEDGEFYDCFAVTVGQNGEEIDGVAQMIRFLENQAQPILVQT